MDKLLGAAIYGLSLATLVAMMFADQVQVVS